MRRLSALLLFPLAIWGCDGFGDGSGPPMTDLTVLLAPASAGASAIQLQAPISLNVVSEISVTVDSVQARLEDPEEVEGAWFGLAVEGGSKTINLVDLPNAGLVLANGSVPSGSYTDARLFFDIETATITLSADACLEVEDGAAEQAQICLAEGTYDLLVSSGAQTGIKTGAQFTLDEGEATVMLEFDADATVRTLVWAPGLQVVIMNPVIRAANEAGD